jgi:hypothetical protein
LVHPFFDGHFPGGFVRRQGSHFHPQFPDQRPAHGLIDPPSQIFPQKLHLLAGHRVGNGHHQDVLPHPFQHHKRTEPFGEQTGPGFQQAEDRRIGAQGSSFDQVPENFA